MSAVPVDTGADDAAPEKKVQVWDLPLRIFHWSLVVAIAAAYVTGEFGGSEWAPWHGRIGSLVLALLVFRLIWGFIGTEHARFRNFVPTPARVTAYLQGRWHGAGHNPLGALAVIALLVLVTAQVVTGLFANDDIAFAGPLSSSIAKSLSERLTGWHQQIFNVLAGFILLHILAILFYLLVRRSNLLTPMLTGHKSVGPGQRVITPGNLAWRFIAAVSVAVAVALLTFRESSSAQSETDARPAVTVEF